MARARIPAAWRQRLRIEFHARCAYCHTPTSITGAQLVMDHILPEAAGGKTILENLCLACHSCNEFKGAQTFVIDPQTGKRVSLFHPRRDEWREHFTWSKDGSKIIGLTNTGRATVEALNMNHFLVVQARLRWVRVGWHPPLEDI